MEEIKVGDYVRITYMYHETKIARITKVLEKDPYYKNMQMYGIDVVHQYSNGHFPAFKIYKEDILKHSSNIIDLIEVGDYVNEYKIIRIDKDPFIKGQINLWIGLYEMDSNGDRWRIKYTNNEIKSIVTKEQFENIEYKVED